MNHNIQKDFPLTLNNQRFFTIYQTLKEKFPEKSIQVRPNVQLKFNGREVESIAWNDNKIILTVNFGGLYGVESPLPGYLLTLLSKETREGERLRDFFHWITEHFYHDIYKARSVYINNLPKISEPENNRNTLDKIRKMTKDLQFPITYHWIYDWVSLHDEHTEIKNYGVLGHTVLLGDKIFLKTSQLCIRLYPQIEKDIQRFYYYIQKQSWKQTIKLQCHGEYHKKEILVLGSKTYFLGQIYGIPQGMIDSKLGDSF